MREHRALGQKAHDLIATPRIRVITRPEHVGDFLEYLKHGGLF
jgi:hypothetical protein